MALPKFLTTVTPVSKILALAIFIIFPFLGFFLGIQFQKIQPEKIQYVPETKIVKVYPTDSPQDLYLRCGDFPDDKQLGIESGKFNRIKGPFWSYDCRHLAWSAWQSGVMGVRYNGPSKDEGLFVYDYIKKISTRIYVPTHGEAVEIKQWQDSQSIIFSKDGQKQLYSYDLSTGKISEIE